MLIELIRFQLARLLSLPRIVLLFGIYLFIIALFANQLTASFMIDQRNNVQGLTIGGDIIAPLLSISLLACLLIMPLILAGLSPLRGSQRISRIQSSLPTSSATFFISDWFCMLTVILLLHSLIFCSLAGIAYGATLDWPMLATQMSGHAFSVLTISSVMLLLQQTCNKPISALLLNYCVVFACWLIPVLLSSAPSSLQILEAVSVIDWFSHSRDGLFYWADLSAYITLLAGCVVLGWWWLQRPFLRPWHKISASFSLLLILTVSRLIPGVIDSSSNHRFSLVEPLSNRLALLEGELEVTGYGLDDVAIREVERRLLTPLEQTGKSVLWQQDENPKQLADSAVRGIQLVWSNRQIWVGYPFQQHPQIQLSRALDTLQRREQDFIGFIEGHDEARIDLQGQKHLGQLNQLLRERGYQTTAIMLGQAARIADNINLVVIAGSRQEWSPKEQTALLEYLGRGGHLLWLRDPADADLRFLEKHIGVSKIAGTLIDTLGYQRGTPHPSIVLVDQYPDDPITRNLTSWTALPSASGLSLESTSWTHQPVLQTHSQVWTEWQPDAEQLTHDEAQGELLGRFSLLVRSSRIQGIEQQRAVTLGDQHWLADSAINNYDNKQLALNLFSWLLEGDNLTLPSLASARDNFYDNRAISNALLSWVMPVAAPLVLLILSGLLWLRAKRN